MTDLQPSGNAAIRSDTPSSLVERAGRAIYDALYDRPVSIFDCEKAARAAIKAMRKSEERTSALKDGGAEG